MGCFHWCSVLQHLCFAIFAHLIVYFLISLLVPSQIFFWTEMSTELIEKPGIIPTLSGGRAISINGYSGLIFHPDENSYCSQTSSILPEGADKHLCLKPMEEWKWESDGRDITLIYCQCQVWRMKLGCMARVDWLI